LVGLKWKTLEKKEGKKKMLSEGLEEGLVAPLELSNRVIEQVEAMAKELRRIGRGIEALVEVVRRLAGKGRGGERGKGDRDGDGLEDKSGGRHRNNRGGK
jgi:hypothetical protein